MKAPLFVRKLTSDEIHQLRAGLRSKQPFTLRRCRIVLASARGLRPSQIALQTGCAVQTVHNVIRAFNESSLECLVAQSRRPKSSAPLFDQARCQGLHTLLRQSPRAYGFKASQWNLHMVALACQQTGLTETLVSIETIRRALARLGVDWKQAKQWPAGSDLENEIHQSAAFFSSSYDGLGIAEL